jgi:polar amino acid transport system substrate-binding protein
MSMTMFRPAPTNSLALLALLAGSVAGQVPDGKTLREALAPAGKLRAVFLRSNPVQGIVDPTTSEVTGIAADLVRELARRMEVPFEIIPTPGTAAVMEAVRTHAADIGFLAYDATRAEQVAFTQPYVVGHNTYLVPGDSPIRSFADADRTGARILVGTGDAVDLHLTRTLKQGQLVRVREPGMEEVIRLLNAGQVQAYAANRQRLTEYAAKAPGLRILEGSVLPVEQCLVVSKENPGAVALLNRFIDAARGAGFLQAVVGRANLAGVEVATPKSR